MAKVLQFQCSNSLQKRLTEARHIKVSAAEYLKAVQLFILSGVPAAEEIVERMEDFANYPEQYYRCDYFEKIPAVRRKALKSPKMFHAGTFMKPFTFQRKRAL